MKKILLSISAMALTGLSFGQTAGENACNGPAANNAGYFFDFEGSASDNCSEDGGAPKYAYAGEHNGMYTYSFSGSSWDIVKDATTSPIADGWRGIVLAFYDGACASQGGSIELDLSGVTSVEIKVNASAAVPQFWFAFYNPDDDNWTDNAPDFQALTVGDNTVTFDVSSTDFWKQYSDGATVVNTKISQMSLYFRTAWNDNNPSGTFAIDYIKLGYDQCPIRSASSLESRGGSVFPNPANDVVNVSVTGASTVELVNLAGQVVAGGASNGAGVVSLNTSDVAAGVYVVSVKSAEGVATSKVVVQ